MTSWLNVEFAGHSLVLDAGLSLYWPAQQTLVVSDLHLEKASFLAQFGAPVAPYDTRDALARLEALLTRYRPRSLILLGDTFHDRHAWSRLEPQARKQLLDLCGRVEQCHWVEGNHDLGLEAGPIVFTETLERDGLVFRHEPGPRDRPQIVGHFHPKLSVYAHGHRLTGRCFALGRDLLIMPAFGSFAGGLDLSDPVFADLAGDAPFTPYLVYKRVIAPAAGLAGRV